MIFAPPESSRGRLDSRLGLHKGHMFFLSLTGCPHSIYFEEDSSMDACRRQPPLMDIYSILIRWSEDVRSPTGLSSFYQIAIRGCFWSYTSCQDTLKNGRITVQLCNIWGVEQTRTGGISLERWDKVHFIGIDECVQCEAPKICLLAYKPQEL